MSFADAPPDYGFDISTLKTHPASIEAEQAVLGGVMVDRASWGRLEGILTPSDFYRAEHRLIFAAMEVLAGRDDPIDPITLADHLHRAGELDRVGGLGYLAEISATTPSAANIRAYAKAVRDRSLLRRLIETGQEIADKGWDPAGKQVGALIDESQSLVLAIEQEGRGEEDIPSTNTALKEVIEEIDRLYNSEQELTGLPTGINALDKRLMGLQNGDLIIVAARPSMGKAQPLTAKVLMAGGGFKEIGSLQVGDRVCSVDGRDSRVSGIFPQGIRPIYRLSLSDGRSVEADADHLWSVESCKWVGQRIITTLDVQKMLTKKRYQGRIRLSGHDGEFGQCEDIGIDPWLLGFLIGDGCLTNAGVRFSNPEQYIIQRVDAATGLQCRKVGGTGCDYTIFHARGVKNPVRGSLSALGVMGLLAHEKHVPPVVFESSRQVRAGVLAGLLESDGWVEKTGSVQFSSSSERLSRDVVQLVRSLGGYARLRVKSSPAYRYLGEIRRGRDAHIVTVVLSSIGEIIKSPRLRKNMISRSRAGAPHIESVGYVRDDEAVCISVTHGSRLYVTDDYLVTHNTTFAMNIAEHNIELGNHVLVFSMEMPRNQLIKKCISSIGRIPFDHVRSGKLHDHEWPALSAAVSKIKDSPLTIDDRNGLSVAQMRTTARRIHRKRPLKLIIVDYLQIVGISGQKKGTRTEDVTEISAALKGLARELDIPIIVLSQLNRELERRPNKRPINSDLRDSGAIEQDADVILFIYRDEVYNEDSPDKGIAEIICRKQRLGPVGTEYVSALLQYSRFENLSVEYLPREEGPIKKTGRGFSYE